MHVPVARLPARFVFHKVPLDVPACAAAIRDHAASIAAHDASCDQEYKTDALIVLVDQEHAHEAATLRQSLLDSARDAPAPTATPVVVAEPLPVEALPRERARAGTAFMGGPASTSCCDGGGGGCGTTTCAPSSSSPSLTMVGSAAASTSASSAAAAESPGGERVAGQLFVLPPGVVDRERCAFVWVGGGGESAALTQALATLHGRCRGVAQVDPATSALSAEATGSAQVGRVIKRRRFLIEKAREARVVGIVAGTLGVAGYLTAIARLRELIARSGRKSYTVVAGKPNPQKLANFPEIEAFVLVACEQAALIDGRDYLQPVITPWEAEVAFTHGSVWDGRCDSTLNISSSPRVGSTIPAISTPRSRNFLSSETAFEPRRDRTTGWSGAGTRTGKTRRTTGCLETGRGAAPRDNSRFARTPRWRRARRGVRSRWSTPARSISLVDARTRG